MYERQHLKEIKLQKVKKKKRKIIEHVKTKKMMEEKTK